MFDKYISEFNKQEKFLLKKYLSFIKFINKRIS